MTPQTLAREDGAHTRPCCNPDSPGHAEPRTTSRRRASRRLGRLGHPPSCASGPAWPGARRHPPPAFWARTGRLHAPDGRMKPLPRGLATPGSEISSRVRPAAAPSGRRPLKTRPARATGRRPPRGPPGAGLERRGGRGRPSRHMWARAGCAGVGGRSTRASTEGEGQAVATVDGRIRVTRAVLNRFQMERGLESSHHTKPPLVAPLRLASGSQSAHFT